MVIKQTAHIIKGLRQDFSDSKQSSEYAIDAKNIRITNRENNTLLSITNEKGTKEVTLNTPILGRQLGYTVINNILVLFTRHKEQESTTDYIYKIKPDEITNTILFQGSLSTENIDHIEALGVYESEDIQKVYWVDGINQPRVINIADETIRNSAKEFDFIQELKLQEIINVEKSYSSGSFSSGVIQYAFNYYNKNGQETNIVDVTPINYISHEDRGASPNEYVSNSFKITITNYDRNFDYLRLYSIHRTALDASPSVKKVADINLSKLDSTVILTYTDTGSQGELIDPVELLYKGGEWIIPQTLAQKDGTLFFGNIKLKQLSEDSELKDILTSWRNSKTITYNDVSVNTFSWEMGEKISDSDLTGYYPFKANLVSNTAGFKARESYRLGIQFQDKTGKWSDPIWYDDSEVNINPETHIYDSKVEYHKTSALLYLTQELKEWAFNKGYIKVRPVVVFPNDEEKEVVAQGILCPTVFNILHRHNNTCFAQSSWFLRPHVFSNLNYDEANEAYNDVNPHTALDNIIYVSEDGGFSKYTVDIVKHGVWPEFRHYKSLPINWKRNSEIANTVQEINIDTFILSILNTEVTDSRENYCVDKSILTFHSPEIELTNTQITTDTKIRLVGAVQFDSNISDINISLQNKGILNDINHFYKYNIGVTQENYNHAHRNLISGGFYMDGLSDADSLDVFIKAEGTETSMPYDISKFIFGYMIYPWGKSGSMNNSKEDSGKLKTKKISNLKFSSVTNYLNTAAIQELSSTKIQICDSEDSIYLDLPENIIFSEAANIDKISYSGNIDSLVPNNLDSLEYAYFYRNTRREIYNKQNGYPIVVSNYATTHKGYMNNIFESNYGPINLIKEDIFQIISDDVNSTLSGSGAYVSSVTGELTNNLYTKENITIKYKSSRHAVLALNYDISGKQIILPNINGINTESTETVESNDFAFPGNIINKGFSSNEVFLSSFNRTFKDDGGYLWLAELYREVSNKFGGDNYENNIWYPAGKSINIARWESSSKTHTLISGLRWVKFTQGDTFFARFDSLKTYSDDLDAVNSVTEIGSFMVETRINLDARYDRNRGKQSNLVMNPSNFNLFNDVYNQQDNFFNYRIIDKDIANNTEFPNTIVWSKQKFAGADIDAWININMASSLDLDGTKGEITKLVSFKNEIFSFQPEAINHILFNSRVQIPTSDGLPIEITNSYKVEGARQLSSVGSSNKLAITPTDRGIYYMDNITKGIYVFNGQQSDPLSDRLGMSSWVRKQDINSYRINYDKINQDVYFINANNCLSYSEKLGSFESFFDYNDSIVFNVLDKTYSIKDNTLYEMFAGDYNYFYDDYKPFWVTITHNENPFNDKIYNTLEFRADSYRNDFLSSNNIWDTIKVFNEYQNTGEIPLTFNKYTSSNLKRKFRIWRANIPRDAVNKRDRIRNTWANITLKASNLNNTKTELHDLVVSYFM